MASAKIEADFRTLRNRSGGCRYYDPRLSCAPTSTSEDLEVVKEANRIMVEKIAKLKAEIDELKRRSPSRSPPHNKVKNQGVAQPGLSMVVDAADLEAFPALRPPL